MSTTAAAESNRGRMRLKINVNVDVANHAELHANAQHVLTSTRATRPKNTTLSYEPKQREFQVRRERLVFITVTIASVYLLVLIYSLINLGFLPAEAVL
jgi:hypothetical protein